tara:strand:+ start:277 stop:714 length:438 start_codon:yes stop_codon:yes gene_type:complete
MSALPAEEPRGFVARSELYRALATIDDLRSELAEERERIGQWLGEVDRLAIMAIGFRRYGAILLSALMAQDQQPMAALSFALSPTFRMDEVNADNVLKVRVCLTRKDIRAMGGPSNAILCHWGTGYSLTPEGRAWLTTKLEGARP